MLKDKLIEPLTVKSKDNRLKKKKPRIFKDFGTNMKGITYIRVMEIMKEEEREKGAEELFETMMTKNFPQISVRHQTTNPGRLENDKEDKCQNPYTQAHNFSHYGKFKIK